MPKKKDIWDKIKKRLRTTLPESDFTTWFPATKLTEIDRENVVIEVPNKFHARWLHENYIDKIQYFLKESFNFIPSVRFTYPENQKNAERARQKKQQEITLNGNFNPSWTFDNFIVGNCNRFAYFSSSEVADSPGEYYNPLYIFGNLSLGKSHLLHAVGNRIARENPGARVKYLTADIFCSDFDISNKSQTLDQFRSNIYCLDCMLLDDIHLFGSRIKPQEELVYLLDVFYKSKRQLVMASKTAPRQTENLIPELKSRLEGGLLAEITYPDENTKRAFIDRRLRKESLSIPEDIVFFLVNSTSDLKLMDKYLDNIIGYSYSGEPNEISMSVVKTIIQDDLIDSADISEIQKSTARFFNISVSDLVSNEKRRDFSYPRQIAMYLSRELTDISYKEIGKKFGNKDHSTIIYAIKRINTLKNKDKKVNKHINQLKTIISS